MKSPFGQSLTQYSRRITNQIQVGSLGLGSDFPIRVQSMTTVDTMDTQGSIDQAIRMINSGCEIVRITAPSVKEAQNLENIKNGLRAAGYETPLVADIHFTPNAAELAARIVEKVRINPGNYADKKRFEVIDYSDQSYGLELERIRERFLPLIKICKEYGTAMRIGTNHGSLSDRILSRYGDTPMGMVESALEFLKICEDENYFNVVLSMKSSNPQVMVQAYRLLAKRLSDEGLKPYPLHLGVTEAGEGEDGRIKSSMGIGTLLEDGLGDTVRVSLTEDPEFESPVARKLIDRYLPNSENYTISEVEQISFDPFSYKRRITQEIGNIGQQNVPRVIADFSNEKDIKVEDLKEIGHYYLPLPDKWKMNDLGVDYIYSGKDPITFMLPNGLKEILDAEIWNNHSDKINKFPLFAINQLVEVQIFHDNLNFLKINTWEIDTFVLNTLKNQSNFVILLRSDRPNPYLDLRKAFQVLEENEIKNPVILANKYPNFSLEDAQLFASTDLGGLFVDGFGDGIMISGDNNYKELNSLAFGILQAARTRISKTEYISCPSCGRTLFDLQETTALIRKRTDHLKGVKIGIMGCIVNGPGEMADADYGYVGIGKDKISLYRGQEVVKRSINSQNAVDELINLIKEDGKWIEKEAIEL
ncbi:4-hydroxy-3-methylbut-2-en-1-yl diphosphate synthase [Lacihabitans sp. LS3-19]|uniref:(E)-4-hydroxy-3-methylbut-2-enyl-diphosphate synthase n=1 Tax=Lacihabitans sp. LS3-19 TaxID=2487335 RepID=UPI0020CDB938|nr:(E)-4-hydroxy-3-methylbut-2-enyl-diphosphate synthase [Lacihabitans sp. LS3-19]MCP9769792.1 4-hydroxy-3-methylbut-2-en-1-yl diphosphate synthase [Lacihabitans sp. LS3-19]